MGMIFAIGITVAIMFITWGTFGEDEVDMEIQSELKISEYKQERKG